MAWKCGQAITAVFFLALMQQVAAAQTLKFGHVYEPGSIYDTWAHKAADDIAKRTDGRYDIDVFPAGSIGNENDIFQGLSLGTVDIALSGSFYASGVYGPMALSSAPFLFRDFDHWLKYRDSDIFERISKGYDKASGNHVLGLMYYGARNLTANREVKSPEDMKGMKLRVPNAPMYTMFPRSVGANPTPIDFSEVYLALQQGVVDGEENPLPTILAKKFYEIQSHIMLTGHIMDSLVVQVSGQVWDGLSQEDKDAFTSVFHDMADGVTKDVRQAEQDLAEKFASDAFDIEVVKVDRAPFRKAMQPLLLGDDMPWTPEDVSAVNSIE